jgi:putative endonuclease
MSFFLYIVECADGTLYTGCTNDLERRVLQHNTSPKGAKYTRTRRPVTLIYSEPFATRGEALSREARVTSWKRSEKLSLIRALMATKKPTIAPRRKRTPRPKS